MQIHNTVSVKHANYAFSHHILNELPIKNKTGFIKNIHLQSKTELNSQNTTVKVFLMPHSRFNQVLNSFQDLDFSTV